MAQSKEYPDLRWIPPWSWTSGRGGRKPTLIVIHTTEGSEGTTSAENGAVYDQNRRDYTSTHYFHDQDSTVQCVETKDTAHTAGPTGNRRGIQHELCGRAGQGEAGWKDAASVGTLRQAAKQAARDAKKYGIPVRKLNSVQVANDQTGFCGHVEVTYAFGEVDHTDPGPTFPWDRFLTMVREFMDPTAPEDEDEMAQHFNPIEIPREFAYDENNNSIDNGAFAVSVPLEPIGFKDNPTWSKMRLVGGLSTDNTPDGKAVRVRVACQNGDLTNSGWSVRYYDIQKGKRVSIELPLAAGPQAYNLVVGRVKSGADPEAWELDVPVSLALAIIPQ